jgi:hypothetical protein
VIGPDVSLSKGVEVLLATASGTVLLVTHEHVKDLVLHTYDEDMLETSQLTLHALVSYPLVTSAAEQRAVRAHDRLPKRQAGRLLHRSRYCSLPQLWALRCAGVFING